MAASQIVGVAAAGLTDGDAQIGADIAKSATSYNYLNHDQLITAAKALSECSDQACRDAVAAKYLNISLEQDLAAITQCTAAPTSCATYSREVANAMVRLEDAYALLGDGPYPEWNALRSSNVEFQEMLAPVSSKNQAAGFAELLQHK